MTVSWVPSVDASTFGQLGRKKGGRDRLSVGAFPLSKLERYSKIRVQKFWIYLSSLSRVPGGFVDGV